MNANVVGNNFTNCVNKVIMKPGNKFMNFYQPNFIAFARITEN